MSDINSQTLSRSKIALLIRKHCGNVESSNPSNSSLDYHTTVNPIVSRAQSKSSIPNNVLFVETNVKIDNTTESRSDVFGSVLAKGKINEVIGHSKTLINRHKRVIRDSFESQSKSYAIANSIVHKPESITSQNTSKTIIGKNAYDVVYSAYSIVERALDYYLSDLEPIEDMIDTYIKGKLIFQFPLRNKHSIVIYAYDDSYNLDEEIEKATLKLYENEKWVTKNGGWVEELEDYLRITENKIRVFGDSVKRRKIAEKEQRFAALFSDKDAQDRVTLWHWLAAEEHFDSKLKLSLTDTSNDFMKELFDLDVIDVIKE